LLQKGGRNEHIAYPGSIHGQGKKKGEGSRKRERPLSFYDEKPGKVLYKNNQTKQEKEKTKAFVNPFGLALKKENQVRTSRKDVGPKKIHLPEERDSPRRKRM